MILQLTVICLLSSHVTCSTTDDQSPLIKLPRLGWIRGRTGKSYFTQRPIYQFFGINYAKPPSGERRFKPPEEFEPWSGVYNATKMRQNCPQGKTDYYPTPDPEWLDVKNDIEDCLVLNVFTPNIDMDKPTMPVMFYIHGGSFFYGSTYDFLPDFLLEDDIILVVIQYRLGPLGFLSLNTTEIPGNMGMLDIILALRWVKTYIRHFGGDPSMITVVGQSAGAAAASALLISPMVDKDLFHKMIIQSGSVLTAWATEDKPIQAARKIAKNLGCRIDNTNEMTSCLKAAPPVDVIEAHLKYVAEDVNLGGLGGCSLVVQGRGPGKFLEKHPREYYAEGAQRRIPIMGGVTRDEGTSFLASFYSVRKLSRVEDERYFQRNITRDLVEWCNRAEDPYGILVDAYQSLYFENRNLPLKDMCPGLVDISGVLVLKQGTFDILRRMSYTGQAFAYSFNFYGGVSKLRASEPEWDKEFPFPAGVAHSDELGYLFPSVKHKYSERELKMVKTLTKFWTNFIKYGSPDGDHWPAMSTPNGPYLRISELKDVRDSFLDEFTIVSKDKFLTGSSWTIHCSIIDILCVLFICLVLFR